MRLTIIGLLLLLTTALVWAGTLTDNFDDGNMDEWILEKEQQASTWKIENGELIFCRCTIIAAIPIFRLFHRKLKK